MFKGCTAIDQLVLSKDVDVQVDFHCPLMSVPGVLGHDWSSFLQNVEFIKPDVSRVEEWRGRLASLSGLKIGLAWQGNSSHPNDANRSFPLRALLPLLKLKGINLISLQKNEGEEQLKGLKNLLSITDLGADLDEKSAPFVETIAVLKNLDLVISCDSALCHFAGAMGVPIWLALSAHGPDWRWGYKEKTTIWYPSMALYRQQGVGNWGSVFHAMANRLLLDFDQVELKHPQDMVVAGIGANQLALTRHGLMTYNKNDIYIGRSLEAYGEFSDAEIELIRNLAQPGQTVVEAGSNIGAHTLPLSDIVGVHGKVYAFEPQRLAFQTLCANMAINGRGNVDCRQAGLGEKEGSMIVSELDLDGASNLGSVPLGLTRAGQNIPLQTIDGLQLKTLSLIKLDVEGMELQVLKGARDTINELQPYLYLENDREHLSPALIDYIEGLGYTSYWHVIPIFNERNYFGVQQNLFNKISSINMLCIPSSSTFEPAGLPRVTGPHADWRKALDQS